MLFDAIPVKQTDIYDYSNLPKNARGTFRKMSNDQLGSTFLADSKMTMDAGFSFLKSELQKLHPEVYNPLWNTTYAKDIDLDIGGGWVDYISYYKTDYAAIAEWSKNLMGNSSNIVPRVNAGMQQGNAKVFTFELAYDLRFVELKKLDRIKMQKDIKSIYEDVMLAAYELFAQQVAYLGINGGTGFFNNTTVVPVNQTNISKAGLLNGTVTDEEITAIINGIIAGAMSNSNLNVAVIPDHFLVPTYFGKVLTGRFSALYTQTLRGFLKEHNLATEEFDSIKSITIESRPLLDTLGLGGYGRIVAYKKDKRFVRMDVPVPFQHLITLPNMERMAYTSAFAGQISEVQFPYNSSSSDAFAPVQYWDLAE